MQRVEKETAGLVPDALTDLSAKELAQKIKLGEVSAREVTEAHIRRIQTTNDREGLNAVVVPLAARSIASSNAGLSGAAKPVDVVKH